MKIGELSAKCKNCGGTEFSLPDDATESSVVTCNSCGKAGGTLGAFQAEAMRTARAAMPDIAKQFGEALKSVKGFKPR